MDPPPEVDWCSLGPFPTRPVLGDDEVHVVRWHRGASDNWMRHDAVLDGGERARGGRFLRARHRERFMAARTLLRFVVGYCVGRPPDTLQFTMNAFGKPRLGDPDDGVGFNLSHAGNLVLLAIARNREVGIDVEAHRPLDVLARSVRFLARAEHEVLLTVAASERQAAFFRCWSRKEAFVKALGLGLSFPFRGFEVSLEDQPDSPVLRACPAAPQHVARWKILPLPIDCGYAASVAAEGHDWRLVRWAAPAALQCGPIG